MLKMLFRFFKRLRRNTKPTIEELICKAIEHIDMMYRVQPSETIGNMHSGFKELDKITLGFKRFFLK